MRIGKITFSGQQVDIEHGRLDFEAPFKQLSNKRLEEFVDELIPNRSAVEFTGIFEGAAPVCIGTSIKIYSDAETYIKGTVTDSALNGDGSISFYLSGAKAGTDATKTISIKKSAGDMAQEQGES